MKRLKGWKAYGRKFGALGLVFAVCTNPVQSFAADGKPAFCPYAAGQIIEPLSVKDVYTRVNPDDLKKDEFETTLAFENRKEESRKLSQFPIPVLAAPSRTYRNLYIQYDADQEVTFINTDQMLKPGAYFYVAVGMNWQADELPLNYHAIQVRTVSLPSDYRNVINSAGDSIQVETFNTQYVHVFSGAKDKSYDDLFIGEIERKFGRVWSHAVEIPMSIDEARKAKSSLQFVAIIQPRKPYTGWLKYFEEAEIDKPDTRGRVHEVDAEIPIVFADISCLAITNQKHEILKIVKANRPPLALSGPVLRIEMPK